jgi:hypothetical protein
MCAARTSHSGSELEAGLGSHKLSMSTPPHLRDATQVVVLYPLLRAVRAARSKTRAGAGASASSCARACVGDPVAVSH